MSLPSLICACCASSNACKCGQALRHTGACANPSCLLCSQLKTAAPTHVAVKRIEAADEAFNRAAASFVAA